MYKRQTIHDEANEKLKPGMVFAVENGVYPYDLEKGVESIYPVSYTHLIPTGPSMRWRKKKGIRI